MGTFKVKSKYYIYGLVLGTVFAVLCQAIFIEISCLDLKRFLSATIIDMAFFAAFFAVRFLYIQRAQWKKLLRRYFQQQAYCIIFLTGFLIAIGFYKVILAPYMAEIDFSKWGEIFQYVFLAISGGLAVTFATVKDTVSDSTGEKIDSDYLMDREINDFNDDKFFEAQVKRFVNELETYSSPVVFGIEGPWGIGKSSFANLCCEELENNLSNNLVIYKFNPLNYDDTDKVLKNFYTGLIAAIKKKYFEPEVEALLESYMEKVISALSEQSIQFIKIKITKPTTGTEQIMKRLEKSLANLDYQIFIVIDDLDRLDFATVKKIFFMMRNVFPFPNLKFIVCYDFEALTQSVKMSGYASKNAEFWLENFINKYINRTYRIYWKNEQVIQFVDDLAEDLLNRGYIRSLDLWKICKQAVYKICKGKKFSKYKNFLGTPRQIKMLFQQLIRISNTQQYQNAEYVFSGLDIVHLLLIYMYYPSTFRKIYDMETRGISGIYSYSYTKGTIDTHLKQLEKVVKTLSCGEQILFKPLFMDKSILSHPRDNYFRACFNEKKDILARFKEGALSRYLHLITLSEVPKEDNNYHTYMDIFRNEILACNDANDVEEIFSRHLDVEENLWSIIAYYLDDRSFSDKITSQLLQSLIQFAMKRLPKYKLEIEGLNVHIKLIIYIRMFLIQLAQKNGNQAVDALFEESGILYQFLYQDLKAVSLIHIFDVLYFREIIDVRAECNDVLPLNDALIHAAEPIRPIDGMNMDEMSKIELRMISQCIYHFFITTFNDKNLWDEFNNLPLDAVFEFNSDISRERRVFEHRKALFDLKKFILYQIGNKENGLAGYDLKGNKDASGIHNDFIRYLINCCFNINKDDNAYFYFVEFMLISIMNTDESLLEKFKRNQSIDSSSFDKLVSALFSIMTQDDLVDYWQNNREKFLNSTVFYEKKFYVNQSIILDAVNVKNIISRLLESCIYNKKEKELMNKKSFDE